MKLAQALAELGMRELVDQAILQSDGALAKQWSRVKAFALMKREDTPWLQSIAKDLPGLHEKIFERFDALATRRLPERRLWQEGEPFYDMPGLRPGKLNGAEAEAYKDAAFSFKLQEWVPASFAHYCSK